jgi:cardiolipin synthase
MHAWLPSPSQHLLWIAASLLVYIASTRLGQIRRPPASAMAWVIGLVLLPYVWLPLFLLFGRRKLRIRSPRSTDSLRRDAEPRHWAAQMIGCFGLPAPAAAAVRFHADGSEALEALWRCIDSARGRLDVCTFLVADDPVGTELIARLTGKAAQGVRVRLLIDGAGAWMARHPSFRPLRRAGGEVALFHPLLGVRHGPRNLRNHRKCVIADQKLLWSGGRNFAAEYFCGDPRHPRPWIDLSFDLSGAVASVAARQFEMDWTHTHGALEAECVSGEISSPAIEAMAQYLPSGPDQAEDTAHAVLIAACFRAKRRLLAVTPYFVPDEALLTSLRLAARRGVRVTLLLPAASNHRAADFVRSRALRVLALAGAEILVLPRMLHAKAVVVDDDFAMTGSVNLDSRSLFINYESAVAFYGKAEVAWLAEWVDGLRKEGAMWQFTPAGLLRDMAEGLVLALAFQL